MKLILKIVLFVLCFSSLNYKAQIYFNNRYDTFGSCDGTNSIDTMFNGYVTAGITCSSVSFYTFLLNSYNYNGTIKNSKAFLIPNNNFLPNYGRYIRLNNTQFLVSGERTYASDTTLAFLWRFNSNLDSISYKEYGFINQTNVISAHVQSGKYIYMVGYNDVLSTNSDILLIKTDTTGNEIWKKKIGVPGWDENAIVIDTLDGKLIIGGLKVLHNTSTTNGLVMCLDTAANIIWQNILNTNNGYAAGNIKTLKDGTILIYNALKKYTISSNDYLNLQCQKVDINNNQIWIKEYNPPAIGAVPVSAIENKHGNIVIAGQRCYSPGLVVNGSVNEIAQNGDSLFSREYAYQSGCQNYFRDIVQAPDGGYCFAGFFTPIFANGCTGSEDIWLLKVDSNFCESAASCGYPTGLKELSYESGEMSLAPNPTSGMLNIELKMLNEKNVTIQLLNSLGQTLLSQTVNTKTHQLNLTELSEGIYFIKVIYANGMTETKKVIKQ